ncbi:LacI family transcriptional regulator [Azospirillum lipoferum]|uniref:LacI family transcriptional regulator n=1 Tax=Azospirillum lipoferum TaxID=193 RepID=A0A5A9GR60_AZOLI|nr:MULTISPECIES: LacI family DNA-binding transcriptional regulator [Azospirillum]KAA0596275.1 LacI family transcriptional regulator [Azospirillum lipoferum]MCP1611246.1 LacI family transcriptional regulator [Azospirillum lipoferum]MDW5533629.1 LacI family DNA-binding transcriptional regulator [Azospirillum sp. NL1]
MVTIRDVAREAGVSMSTVSHVINATRFVAPETEQLVRAVIDRLGYTPNGIARALKGNRTRTLGMIVTASSNPFFAHVIHGLETVSSDRGYSLILCNTDDEPDKQLRAFEALHNRRIDGLAVMTSNADPEFLDDVQGRAKDLPLLLLDTDPRPGACTVTDDSVLGGRLAARLLTERGFRRIACITGPGRHPRSRARLAGFVEELGKAGLTLEPALLREADLTIPGGYAAAADLLDSGEAPEAVFAFNDLMAAGVLRAAAERGLAVPDRLSVLGYDDIELAAYLTPPLSTIRQSAGLLGARAAELLIDHLEDGRPLPDLLSLPPDLVLRASVGWPCARLS